MTPILLSLALALLSAMLGGNLCARVGVPRVTGYLLVGVALGPSLLARFSGELPAVLEVMALRPEITDALRPIKDAAQALILFIIGMGMQAARLRRIGTAGLALLGADVGLTLVLVVGAMAVATWFSDPAMAVVLGAAAVATAPAATLLVIRELDSEGPTTRTVLYLVALNNVAALLLFALAFGGLVQGDVGSSLLNLGRGAAVGLVGGIALSTVLLQATPSPRVFAVLGLGGVLAAWGVAQWIGGNPLLATLVLGATLVNGCPQGEALLDAIKRVDYPLYVAFFVLSGASLHVDLLLGLDPVPGLAPGMVALLTLAYVVGRSAGKVLCVPMARLLLGPRRRPRVDRRAGLALLAQAGLAIALADMAVKAGAGHPELRATARVIEAVILSSVTVFELAGPLAVRFALIRAGEVKIVNLLPARSESVAESLQDTLTRLRSALGLPQFGAKHDDASSIRAVDVMRRNIRPLRAGMHFDDVVRRFAQTPLDQYPVVNSQDAFQGVISLAEIRSLLFDKDLAEAVVAADLITGSGVTCEPSTTLPQIIDLFERAQGEFSHLPVVEAESTRRVVGIVSQHDAIVAFRRHT